MLMNQQQAASGCAQKQPLSASTVLHYKLGVSNKYIRSLNSLSSVSTHPVIVQLARVLNATKIGHLQPECLTILLDVS